MSLPFHDMCRPNLLACLSARAWRAVLPYPLAVALTLLAAGAAWAGAPARRAPAADLTGIVAESDAIIHGLVLSAKARWVVGEGGRRIRTYATVRCHSWLKGAGGAEVVVDLPGGLVGEVREQVTPGVRLGPGEEVVLFLKGKGSPLSLAGYNLGKFLVERGAAHGALGRMPLGDLVGQVRMRLRPDLHRAPDPPQPPAPRSHHIRSASETRTPESAPPGRQTLSAPAPQAIAKLLPGATDGSAAPTRSDSSTHTGAIVAQALARASTLAGWTTIKSETFEGAWPNDWTLYGNIGDPAITWGTETYKAHLGSKGGWPATPAYNPATSYMPKGSTTALISRMTYGPFDLRGTSDARVTFWTTYELDTNDKLRWEVSKDGTTFYGYFQGQGNTLSTWSQVTLDLKSVPTLGNLCGHNGIYFRLQCDSAPGGTWVCGPFVDDVVIEKYVVDNMPDLAVDSFSVTPRTSTQGTTLTASVTVRNAGTSAVGAFNVDFYRSRTSAPGSGDAGDHTWNVAGLGAGASTVLTWDLSPAAAAGTYHAYAVIDRANSFAENDESNNRKGPISYFVTQTGWQVLKLEDFEGSWPNDWSVTSQYSNTGTWAPQTWLASDTKAGGGQASLVDPAGNPGTIEPGCWGRMTYGPFSLAGASQARMTLFLSYQLGPGDAIRWQGSTDGSTFSGGSSYTGGSNLGNWTLVTFDLSSFLGSSSVYVRLSCEADGVEDNVKGPFVDDIVIERFGESLPSISGIGPPSASAGTDTQVTITGTNFAATQGTGSVNFLQAPGYPKIPASIVSWSNTSIVCTVPEDASSGPVTVVNSAGAESNNSTFTVTFGYGGAKWAGASPIVGYRVNENATSCNGEAAAVRAGADTWTTAGAAFAFRYDGTTAISTVNLDDGVNAVFWTTSPGGPGAGYAYTRTVGGYVTACDIAFNDNINWSTSEGGEAGKQDIQTVATHELGHCLKLSDLYGDVGDGVNDVAKALYGVSMSGEPRRNLAQADREGIQWIYGATATLGITVDPVTWSIAGLQPQGATCLTAAGTRFTVQNTGNVTETLRLRIATEDNRGKWHAGSAAGAEQYWLRALFVGGADTPVAADYGGEDTATTAVQPATATRFNRPAGTYGVSMAASAFAYLWFRLDLPTIVTDGDQHQITVEVSCETP